MTAEEARASIPNGAPAPYETSPGARPIFPGGVSVSRLAVYDWPAADGLRGGTPHLHTASAEGYVVLSGRGAVRTLSSAGAEQHPLEPGRVVWFEPGTVHRLVNDDALELLVVMANAGLPESGDAVMTFPASVLSDPVAYAAAASLGTADEIRDAPEHLLADRARARRDLALHGHREWSAAVERHGPAALAELHALAAALVRPRIAEWERILDSSAARAASGTAQQLAAMAAGGIGSLGTARVASVEAATGRAAPADDPAARAAARPAFGMCGRLTTWPIGAPVA